MQKSAIWGLVSFVLAGLGLGADLMSHKKACEELAEAKGIGEEKSRDKRNRILMDGRLYHRTR